MRVMVTGVTGQIGSALVKNLEPLGPIIAADRNVLDLARSDIVPSVLDGLRPDMIVNAAAYTAVDRAEDEKELAFRVNAEAPGAIARWAADRGALLVHFSTDYVFDGAGSRPWREEDKANPLSVYGASKHAGDEAIRSAGGPHLIVRTSWVYAAHGENFLRTIADLAKKRKALQIVADQIGAPTSARLIADSVTQIIGPGDPSLADRFATAKGVLNIAAAGETSWYGFAVAIVEGLKARGVRLAVESIAPVATKDYPVRAARPANCRLDLTRLRQVFGIDPPTWDRALAAELDAFVGPLDE